MIRRLACLTVVAAGASTLLLAAPAQAVRVCETHDTTPVKPRISGYTCVDTNDPNLIDCAGSVNGVPFYQCA